jgi:hypothetical protein
MRRRSWTETQLKKAVTKSRSIRQVLHYLGLKESGGNYAQLKKYIKEYNLNDAHFKGRGWSKGLTGIGKPRIPLKKILVKNSTYQSYKLKKRLFAAGLKAQYCEKCGWAKRSSSGRLPLELDHINGDSNNNRLENLRILCPNCHSLEPNYRGRNRKKRV